MNNRLSPRNGPCAVGFLYSVCDIRPFFIRTMGLHLHKAQKAIKEFDRSMADLFMVHRQMHLGSNHLKYHLETDLLLFLEQILGE